MGFREAIEGLAGQGKRSNVKIRKEYIFSWKDLEDELRFNKIVDVKYDAKKKELIIVSETQE